MASTVNFSDYLSQIAAQKARYKSRPQSPALPEELDQLRQQTARQFGYNLPESYAKLLALSDGVNFNGYTLYASKTCPISGRSDRLIEGFLEANDLWEDYAENIDHHLIMFGETGDDLYLFDRRDQQFKITDKVGGDAYETFDTFEELAERLLKNALGLFDEVEEE